MTSFPILDLIAGIIFIYFLLSLINNSLVELIFSWRKTRAKDLGKWIITIFSKGNHDFAYSIMNHPLLTGASEKNKSSSYMESKSFAIALVDLFMNRDTFKKDNEKPLLVNLKESIKTHPNLPEEIKSLFLQFIERTNLEKNVNNSINELSHFESQITNWFDSSMNRLMGQLKRSSMIITFVFGIIISFGLNIDSIALAKYLYNNPEANAKLAAAAYQEASDSTMYKNYIHLKENLNDSLRNNVDSMMADIQTTKKNVNTALGAISLGIPIGWTDTDCKLAFESFGNFISKLGGLLMTVLAMLLGAPFWFEVLGKIANLRSSLKPKDTPTPTN